MANLKRLFPFLGWFPYSAETVRADIVAGVTVALVLIPQSMAYAQLAGLPPYYGLYAAFLPPLVAAIFGSSAQLSTGPVAVVSLLTAAALEPIATAGSEAYIAYAILLALMVGLFQLALGLLRLGVLVYFLSHAVVVGFTNAAAIIIATSQLGKIFGVSVEKAEHHYETVWNTIVAAFEYTHWPTFSLALLAFTVMIVLRKISPRIPSVLIAVALTTVTAWMIDYNQQNIVDSTQFANETISDLVAEQRNNLQQMLTIGDSIRKADQNLRRVKKELGEDDARTLTALHQVDFLRLRAEKLKQTSKANLKELRGLHFEWVKGEDDGQGKIYLKGHVPTGMESDGKIWRIVHMSDDGTLQVNAGGKVVGSVPRGLPSLKMPSFDIDTIVELLISMIAIALIGFMEAISIAKAMATRTRQHLDANQELVGQGLSNIVGSIFQSYPVSGSFSRSAVNINSGAITGLSSVVTSLMVVVTLLLLTPLLFHLPQATLAAVIMMAVIGLVNIRAMQHIWSVHQVDGIICVITFVLTLAFAPHLDQAIIVGVLLSLGVFLYHSMKPRVAVLARHPDGSLRDADLHRLQTCPNITVVRFDGSLYFANTSYFEDLVLRKLMDKPDMKFVIVDAEGMNELDATGEEMLVHVTERLDKIGVKLLLARVKNQIWDVLRDAGYIEHFGKERFYRRTEYALEYAWSKLEDGHKATCPLHVPTMLTEEMLTEEMSTGEMLTKKSDPETDDVVSK
ncbi:SulP family inorganic anion transporter [Kaarinaea lacus]